MSKLSLSKQIPIYKNGTVFLKFKTDGASGIQKLALEYKNEKSDTLLQFYDL